MSDASESNFQYVSQLLGDDAPEWAIEQLAGDLDARDESITKLSKELREAEATLTRLSAPSDAPQFQMPYRGKES